MEAKATTRAKRMTKQEFLAESDRLLREAQGFLEVARQTREKGRHLAEEADQLRASLRERLLCGKDQSPGSS